MLDFSGQIVFLTGAAGEIGAATAELFLQRGAKVISTDLTIQAGSDRIDFDANPVKIGLDVTDREEEWDRVFAVNAKGLFFVCQAALEQMMEQKGGCFVNLGSISGQVGGVLAGAEYSASKAAVICLTKSLAKVGAPYGIRANSVAPAAIYSPMLDQYYEDHAEEMKGFEANHPFGRFGKAVEVAEAVLFLASDAASYITGTCLDVNGGTRMN